MTFLSANNEIHTQRILKQFRTNNLLFTLFKRHSIFAHLKNFTLVFIDSIFCY